MRKQQDYQLLDEDARPGPVESASKKESTRKHLRKKREISDDDEIIRPVKQGRSVRNLEEENDEEEAAMERAREEHLREREDFEARLRERDEVATKKVMEPKLSRSQEEEAKKRAEAESVEDLVPVKREAARQSYLKSHKQKKLDGLKDSLEDEAYLFEGVKKTAKEEEEIRFKSKMYELAEERTEDVDAVLGYQMPKAYDDTSGKVRQDERFGVATQRYKDVGADDKMNPFAEQEAWEKHQIALMNCHYTKSGVCPQMSRN